MVYWILIISLVGFGAVISGIIGVEKGLHLRLSEISDKLDEIEDRMRKIEETVQDVRDIRGRTFP